MITLLLKLDHSDNEKNIDDYLVSKADGINFLTVKCEWTNEKMAELTANFKGKGRSELKIWR